MPEWDFTPDPERPRGVTISPVLRVNFEPLRPGLQILIDAFIAECVEAGAPTPDPDAMFERAQHIVENLDPAATDGINSLVKNKRIVFVHKDSAPYFGATTEG